MNLAALEEEYTANHPNAVAVQAQIKVLRARIDTLLADREQAQSPSAARRYNDDRGRVYGVLGPPDQIVTEGDGQSWTYRHIEGAGDQVTFRFTNLGGSGRFVLAAPPTAGANANQSGLTSLASRVKAYGGQSSAESLDVKVLKPLEIKPPDPSGASPVTFVISIQAPGAKLNIYERITTMTQRLVQTSEDTVDVAPGQAEYLYPRTVPLAAGHYRLKVLVRDPLSGRMATYETAIEVQP